MEPREQARAPMINGVSATGSTVEADYAANLVNVVTFFEPVSKNSLGTVERVRLMSRRYEKLSVGFWQIMEPRLSCMYHAKVSQMTLDRLSLFDNTILDANSMIVLQFGIKELPAVLVIDSNSLIKCRFEGEVSLRGVERSIQARLALSGYRDDLPDMGEVELDFAYWRGGSTLKQLGYVTGDYVFTSLAVPETNQEFLLPNLCLLNTIYPHGPWFVGRDFIEGSAGSTVYVSCARDETVIAFACSDDGAVVRMHTSIQSPQNMILGKDVKKNGHVLDVNISECRPYEILAASGDTDVLISLQVFSGSLRLYSVEFCELVQAANSQPIW